MELPGYTLGERVYESVNSIVYRATRDDDGLAVFAKMLPTEFPPPSKLTRLRREYTMTRGFDDERIIKALALEQVGSRLAMMVEDFGGCSLDVALQGDAQSELPTRLRMAIDAAAALERVHDRHIIHKDINPANLVWSAETGQLKVIDFGISTELSRETPGLLSPEFIEGTLAFMSPEQTGRMNRVLDYRSDLYSLGATLYWLFTGARPFETRDPMELVHCHIARIPDPPHERSPAVPPVLSRIILKLLAKNAEDRYQSSTTLRADLQRCLDGLDDSGAIPVFELETRDLSEQFSIPQRLYGRDQELDQLLTEFGRVAEGGKALLLVAGYSGIGKSALVHEVHKPIVERQGFFSSGKFDQFNRSIPYASLIQAFKSIVQQLLTETEESLRGWRERLQAAVGVNGQVILDVIPDVALVVGEQPPVPELPPVEAQNRFDTVFADFVRVFAAPEHPLTLFLDDLQWADGPSLRLIDQFMTDAATRPIFLIGAYRDNEVDPTHPLMHTLNEIRQKGAAVSTIALGPLAEQDVGLLLAHTLQQHVAAVQGLTTLCLDKTRGNPFFLNRLLQTVYEEGGFRIDREAGSWTWDLDAIERMQITDNVVDLMVNKIRKLSERTQLVLQLGACIGASFDLQTLSIVSEEPPLETAEDLREAIREDLVLPAGADYKFLRDRSEGPLGRPDRIRYRWLHDRVQQAAYALIAHDRKASVHYRLGRLMLDNLPARERDEKLFEIVGHLNLGAGQCSDRQERDALVELNLEVGRKAIASCAFRSARGFLDRGLELLGDDGWTRRYDLALQLHTEAAHATHLVPDFEATKRHYDQVLAHGRTILDKVPVYEIWILACQAQAKVHEGIATALEILDLLGVRFPTEPTPEDFGRYLQRVGEAVGERAIESLIDLPPNEDPAEVAAIRLLANIASTAYIGAPALFPLLILEAVARSAANGNTGASAFVYATHGILLCGVLEDFDTGLRFGQLGQAVLARYDAKEYAAKVSYVYTSFILFWTVHLRESWAAHLETHRLGLENGDHEFAAWPIMTRTQHALFMGLPLDDSIAEARATVETCYRLNQATSGSYAEANLQAMLGLAGQSEDPCVLQGEAYDEHELVPRYVEASEAFGLCNVYVTKALLCYLWDRWEDGLRQEELAAPWASAIVALVHVPVFRFYICLSRLAVARSAEADRRTALLEQADQTVAAFGRWADHCPDNFLHKHRMLLGERKLLDGEAEEGQRLLREAVSAAEASGYVNEQALAQELLGRSWILRGDAYQARSCLEHARHLYQVWGAAAKVQQLEAKYPELLAQPDSTGRSSQGTTQTTTRLEDLDIGTVLKATQAISSEVQREGLLQTLLEILIENAGARGGALIREEEGQPLVEVRCRPDGEIEVLDSVPMSEVSGLPSSVLNLVRRTREAVVIDDVDSDARFVQDQSLQTAQTRSILCLPVEHQGKLVASLYLENDLSPGAFTKDRIDLLRMLLTQVAISLENARLYGNLEAQVDLRTRELEQALRQLQEQQDRIVTQEKLASLGSLTAGIAHEINNPLNLVSSFSSLSVDLTDELSELLGPGTDPSAKELLTLLQQNSHKVLEHSGRASEIVKSMLSHSRGYRGDPEPTNLNALTNSQLQLEEFAGLQVEKDLDPKLPPVEVIPQSLCQALRNVLRNAGHAMRDRLEAEGDGYQPSLRLSTRAQGDWVELRIHDNGAGMAPEVRDQAFVPFFTTKSNREGIGLGLSIAHDVVTQLHWGEVLIESEPGRFTEVTIRLPRRHRPAESLRARFLRPPTR